MSRGNTCWRELRRQLRVLGAKPIRTKGSRQIWRFEDGETFVLVCNHLAHPVPSKILSAFERLRSRKLASRHPSSTTRADDQAASI